MDEIKGIARVKLHPYAPQIHRRAHLVGLRGVAGKAILMVQPSQNRRRDHLGVFGDAMTGGHELVPFGQGLGDPGSQAGMWTTPVMVGYPFAKDRSEMCLVDRDQPIETLPT